ncbi:MAG: hypothetical protein J6O61_02585 [Butyrivibrio sp.]|uniref:hypothetical protein n=1 Tax=Butyrivibrio sp. TaxID=28121 RepID=UPI001B083E23|nr:hypothetical protein [Butyrivibrio sp.]MBO6239716.1 hypothetical protein [Butyrivibrio sp.]
MPYNGYNESRKNPTLKYMKNKMKIINLRIPKDKYEREIEPYIEKSGMPTGTFIKTAIKEKLSVIILILQILLTTSKMKCIS